MDTVYTALVFPLLLLIGQTLVALGQRKISQRMDEGQAKTDEKRLHLRLLGGFPPHERLRRMEGRGLRGHHHGPLAAGAPVRHDRPERQANLLLRAVQAQLVGTLGGGAAWA